ncbi:piggyBac transposable element-derived protein 4-like [Lingula anatina]|uniref:PiggyBac transposable element-derived protein 4-like n=1 Tax=Lingula anatina TaxID=7574 RepID=A0A1S3HZ01_LINAN|nr:piggyBac transposable element-derived protein 4-like [Lingula anatina]|eukprot:XP_013391250.1 piggyBac transposable element-derived protein 4-like [Lingula anatina]
MAALRHRRGLRVDSVLEMIQNSDFEDDFSSESDLESGDDVPLARINQRRADSDEELDLTQDLGEQIIEDEIDHENIEWNNDINSRDSSNIRFRGKPGLSENAIEELGGKENLPVSTPGQLFGLLFTHALLVMICQQTNLYAQQEREASPGQHKCQWTEVTPSELKSWLGIIFTMGLVIKANLRDYWTSNWLTSTSGFRKVMSRNRFLSILRYIHFVDNSSAVTDRNNPAYDKLYKVRPVLDRIVQKIRTVYAPKRELSLDESMVACKSRCSFKQFMRDKPIRWGLKLFMISESVTGYVCNLKVYTGKEKEGSDNGATHDVVLSVTSPFLNKGHHLYMDNYYTSVPAFQELLRRSTPACGTVRANRKGLPNTVNAKFPVVKELKRGDSIHMYKGSLTAVTWKDKKTVTLLTSLPVEETSDIVQRSAKVSGKWEKINVTRPKTVTLYNTYMGGADLSDQRINAHKRMMKGVVWYLKLFWFLLDTARVNSYILYKKTSGKSMKLKDFTCHLAEELIGQNVKEVTSGRPLATLPTCVRSNRDLNHAPAMSEDRKRSACAVHLQRVDTIYICTVCKVRMCPAPCFYRYHYMVDYT